MSGAYSRHRLQLRWIVKIAGAAGLTLRLRGDSSAWSASGESSSCGEEPCIQRIQKLESKVEAIFREHMLKENIPGLTYGIICNGKVVLKNSMGVQDVASRLPVTDSTRFRIASMTKSFTAMAIVQLRDRGVISFSDPISKYVPAFASLKLLTADSPIITIHDLLIMVGGLPQDDPWGDRLLDWSEEQLQTFLGNGLTFSNPVGVSFEYSNLGYAILGLVISKASQMSYQQYVTKNILLPLGMLETTFEVDEVPREHLALGYRWEENQWKPEPYLHDGIFGAMGGLITTAHDFAKYVTFHQSAWPPSTSPSKPGVVSNQQFTAELPISPASLREMHKPSVLISLNAEEQTTSGALNPKVLGYGYGLHWSLDKRNVTVVRHAGGLPGFGSEWRFLPHHKLGIVSFGNRTYSSMSIANTKVMDLLLTENAVQVEQALPSTELSAAAKGLAQLILNRFQDHQKSNQLMASNFFLDKPEHLWVEDINKRLPQDIDPSSVVISDVIPLNNLRGKFIIQIQNSTKSNKPIEVFFTMNPEFPNARIQAVTIT